MTAKYVFDLMLDCHRLATMIDPLTRHKPVDDTTMAVAAKVLRDASAALFEISRPPGDAPLPGAEPDSAEQKVETLAAEIYSGWFALPGYVPWVERGNSDRQEDARRMARAVLEQKKALDVVVALSQDAGMPM